MHQNIDKNPITPGIQHAVEISPIKYTGVTNRLAETAGADTRILKKSEMERDLGPGSYNVVQREPKYKRFATSSGFKSEGHVDLNTYSRMHR